MLVVPYAIERGIPLTITNKNGDEWIYGHTFLKIASVGAVLGLLLIGPVVIFQENSYCSTEVNTTNMTGNFTQYTYDRICFENTSRAPIAFMRGYNWTLYVFLTYFGIFTVIIAIYAFRDFGRKTS